eukprot:14068256-Alexandrium_andersonii.AAC.1
MQCKQQGPGDLARAPPRRNGAAELPPLPPCAHPAARRAWALSPRPRGAGRRRSLIFFMGGGAPIHEENDNERRPAPRGRDDEA